MKTFKFSSIPSYIVAIAEDVRDSFFRSYLDKFPDSQLPPEISDPTILSTVDYWDYNDAICRLMYKPVSDGSINVMVSPHFSLFEILSSHAAKCHNVENDDFSFTDLLCAVYLIYFALEPIRVHYNRPVVVTSFYRCEELNRIVGGVANSRHLLGCAADIKIEGVPSSSVFKFCVDRSISCLKYDTFNHIQATNLYE